MKRPFLPLLVIGALATAATASPLSVGSTSDDVGFSEGTVFSGSVYTTLEPRHLSDFPDRVLVLVYFTPW